MLAIFVTVAVVFGSVWAGVKAAQLVGWASDEDGDVE
jgi:hypothetical protein